jgi:hypothetical protein
MQASAQTPPPLRLVRPPAGLPRETLRSGPVARSQTLLAPTDPRWVFAVRVAYSLEGGKAALLRPGERRHLTRLSRYLGLRPFDANLIIAVVQDAARSGDSSSARVRLGPEVAQRLAMLDAGSGNAAPDRVKPLQLIVASLALAAVFAVWAARWIVAG